jgi:hypothetical protein
MGACVDPAQSGPKVQQPHVQPCMKYTVWHWHPWLEKSWRGVHGLRGGPSCVGDADGALLLQLQYARYCNQMLAAAGMKDNVSKFATPIGTACYSL